MKRVHCLIVYSVVVGGFVVDRVGADPPAGPVQLLLTMPTRMVDSKTLTLKAEILDSEGRINWRTCNQLGMVSATRVSDNSAVPISVTVFETLMAGAGAGGPPPGSIRFYNGVGSVSITLDTGADTAPGDIRVTVTVGALSASKIVTVLDGEQPALFKNLSGTLFGADLTWGPNNGVIHLTGNVFVDSGRTLTIQPGTLVMVDSGTPAAGVTVFVNSGGVVNAQGTPANPVFFFPTSGPAAMSLPQTTTSNFASWRGFYHSGLGISRYSNVFVTGAGNGAVTGHPRPPIFRFSDAHGVVMDNCVVADCPGMGHSALLGAYGTYTIRNTLFSRNGIAGEWRGAGYTLTIEDCWFTRIGRAPEPNGVDGDILHVDQPGGSIHVRRSILTDGGDDIIDHSMGAQPVVEDCILYDVRDKAVSLDGSAGSTLTMTNSLVFNTPNGLRCAGLPIFLTHCTIGQAAIVNNPSCVSSVVDRSIVWPNLYNSCCGNVNYSLLGAGSDVSCGTGNFIADPLFVQPYPAGCNYDPGAGSPAATAGPAQERIGWLGFTAPRHGALVAGGLTAGTSLPGGAVGYNVSVQDARDVHGYQTVVAVTRLSGAGTLTVDCPGGVQINEGQSDYVFFGLGGTSPSTNCPARSASSSLTGGSVDVVGTPKYLSSYTLRVSPDATPNTTFEVRVLGFGGSSLVDSAANPIAFATGPASVVTVIGCPVVVPGDMNGDGLTNGDDIQAFVLAVMNHSTAIGDVCPGDFSHNAVVAQEDVPGMVSRLLGI